MICSHLRSSRTQTDYSEELHVLCTSPQSWK